MCLGLSQLDLALTAGFPQAYPTTDVDDLLDGPVGAAVRMMLDHHEPLPLVVMTRLYDLVALNDAAERLFAAVGIDRDESNLVRLFSAAVRALVCNWEETAGTILRRLQREALHRPNDEELADLVAGLLVSDGVPEDWRQPCLAAADEPVVPIELRTPAGQRLSFMTTVTIFSAPQNLTLDELQIESWFPLDDTTEAACRALAG